MIARQSGETRRTALARDLGQPFTRGSAVLASRAWARLTAHTPDDRWAPLTRCAGCAGAVWLVAASDWATWTAVAAGTGWVAAAWTIGYRPPATPAAVEEQPPTEPGMSGEELLLLLHELDGATHGVHLTQAADALGPPWDVPAVRALCEEAGIPVRRAVRVRGRGVTVGVHRADLPPAPPLPLSGPPVAVVAAGQRATATATPTVERHHGGALILIPNPTDARQSVTRRTA